MLLLLLSIAVSIAVVLLHGTIALGQDVGSVARQITVRVEGAEPGSGVLIGRQDHTYYVLTAKHVVRYPDNYAILTPDGSIHPVTDLEIRRIPEVDLAILGFTSDRDYTVATVGDSDLATETTPVWVAGFPLPGRENDTPLFHITDGQITARPLIPNSEGYALTYSNITRAGMSGGPVIDSQGHVIGIHGLSEAEPYSNQEGTTIPISGWTNLGIPINIFRTVAPLMEVELVFDSGRSNTGNDPSDCVAQLRFKDITSTNGPDDDGEWRFPVTVIGPQNDPESLFGPGGVPGSSMQAVGCHVKHSGLLGSTITWRCPAANLRVETMSVAQANAQCNGSIPPDPTPQATARREQLGQQEELLQQLAATCRRFKADYDYWQERQQTCSSFDGACRTEALAGEQEAERQWRAAGCDNEWGSVWSPFGVN